VVIVGPFLLVAMGLSARRQSRAGQRVMAGSSGRSDRAMR
jgi:hypothetical protein